MPRRRIGLMLIAAGIVVFSMAMYGVFRELSLFVAIAALAALLLGLVILVSTLGSEPRGAPHMVVLALAGAALALHLYESAYKSSGAMSIGFLTWAMVPYGLAIALSSFAATRKAAIAGALAALVFDLFGHYSVFFNPKSSTAGLALLFIPLWNTLILVPAATAIALAILRRRSRPGPNAP